MEVIQQSAVIRLSQSLISGAPACQGTVTRKQSFKVAVK